MSRRHHHHKHNQHDNESQIKSNKTCDNHCVKLNQVLEGMNTPFPGNGTLTEFFKFGFKSRWTRMYPGRLAITEVENSPTADDQIIKSKKLTYGELDEISDKLALIIKNEINSSDLLKSNQNPDNDIVIGVCIPPSDKLIISLFAIMKLGCTYLPFDPVQNPEQNDFIRKVCSEVKPIMILGQKPPSTTSTSTTPDADADERFQNLNNNLKFVNIEDLFDQIANKTGDSSSTNSKSSILSTAVNEMLPGPNFENPAERIACIIYTSCEKIGSRLSHRAIMNRLFWFWKRFPYKTGDVICCKTPVDQVDSITEIFAPLLQGYPIVILSDPNHPLLTEEPKSLKDFLKKCSFFQITQIILKPYELKCILRLVQEKSGEDIKAHLKSIELWICSGQLLPSYIAEEFFKHFPKNNKILANFYGSCELGGNITFETFTAIKEVREKIHGNCVPIGKPVYNNLVYLLDDNLKIVREGSLGEICIAGFSLLTGVVGQPLENSPSLSTRFAKNPYSDTKGYDILLRTGDFGHVEKTRHKTKVKTLFLDGKKDRLVRIKGHRVSMNELECYLEKNEIIKDCGVISYQQKQQQPLKDKDQPNSNENCTQMIAFVVPKNPDDVELVQVKDVLNKKLKEHERPEFHYISQVPRLVNGRVDRGKLTGIYNDMMKINPNPKINYFGVDADTYADQEKSRKLAVEEQEQLTETEGSKGNEVKIEEKSIKLAVEEQEQLTETEEAKGNEVKIEESAEIKSETSSLEKIKNLETPKFGSPDPDDDEVSEIEKVFDEKWNAGRSDEKS